MGNWRKDNMYELVAGVGTYFRDIDLLAWDLALHGKYDTYFSIYELDT